MARVSFFVDGFNLYHALDNKSYRCFQWIDLSKLAGMYLRKQDCLADVFYFTAFATWDADKVRYQKRFIRAQEAFGVTPIYGKFRIVTKRCRVCNRQYDTFEEKETDVNIAIKLYEQASADTFDTAVILSGDSDMVPVVRAVKKNFPHKKIGILIPPGGRAEVLKSEVHFYSKIHYKHISSARLPDPMILADGSQIFCPDPWKP